MQDMLVKLYTLPPLEPAVQQQKTAGIEIRRALAPEKYVVIPWVGQHFYQEWQSECEVAFTRQPAACFVAIEKGQLIGFACHDTTCQNFFGPTGVTPAGQGRGTGKALLLACLHAMAAQGYAYAIIGGVGPVEFYEKTVGATLIPDSTPGIFGGMLRGQRDY